MNSGSPRVPARPFVSGVESRGALAEGRWREIERRGWEGVWLRDKPRCTMEVLIFDRSSDLPKLPRGLGFRLPKGLPSPCLLLSSSLCLSLSLYLASFQPLSLPSPATALSSPLATAFTLSYMNAHIWQRGLIKDLKRIPRRNMFKEALPKTLPDRDTFQASADVQIIHRRSLIM